MENYHPRSSKKLEYFTELNKKRPRIIRQMEQLGYNATEKLRELNEIRDNTRRRILEYGM